MAAAAAAVAVAVAVVVAVNDLVSTIFLEEVGCMCTCGIRHLV